MLSGVEGAFTFPARDVRLFETITDVWNRRVDYFLNCFLFENILK